MEGYNSFGYNRLILNGKSLTSPSIHTNVHVELFRNPIWKVQMRRQHKILLAFQVLFFFFIYFKKKVKHWESKTPFRNENRQKPN
jgi:hypothetical protein